MRFFFLILIALLPACTTSFPKESRPSLRGALTHNAFQRRLDLREHPDSMPWRRVFTKGSLFVILEPGLSHIRVGDEALALNSEVRLWGGQLYLPRGVIDRVQEILDSSQVARLYYPQWVPVNEKPWRYIVIHHSAINTGNAAIYDRYHRDVNGWSGGLGYHFVIGNGTGSKDGEVEVGPRWHRQTHGAHASSGPDNIYNLEGIGVCLVGDFNLGIQPSSAQMESLVELVSFLRQRYDIPIENIVAHRHVPRGTVTKCPGDDFPWHQFLRKVQ